MKIINKLIGVIQVEADLESSGQLMEKKYFFYIFSILNLFYLPRIIWILGQK